MMPDRAGMPYVPWRDPCEATRLLRYELPRHGFLHISQCVQPGSSAPSLSAEPNVRCEDGPLAHAREAPPPASRSSAARQGKWHRRS